MNEPHDLRPNPVVEPTIPTARSLEVPLFLLERPSVQLRIKFFITGVILPGVCFVAAAIWKGIASTETPWQSGKLVDYVAMLLQWPGFAPFLPLVLYGAVSLGIWCFRPESSGRFAVRLGIYSGTIVSTQFMLLVMVGSLFASWFAAVVACAILAAVVFAIDKLLSRSKRFQIWHIMLLTTIVACLSVLARLLELDFTGIIFAVPFLFLAATPTLTPVTFLRASIFISEQVRRPDSSNHRPKLWPLFAIGWLAAWLASWRWAVHVMLDEYSKLPTTNPNCYVSSAAANGHPQWVGSCENPRSGMVVNDQMRRLKFLEIALQAMAPPLHQRLRSLYDRIGPPLARQCKRSIWLADLSYIMLKPAEWLALGLRAALNIDAGFIRRIYHDTRDDHAVGIAVDPRSPSHAPPIHHRDRATSGRIDPTNENAATELGSDAAFD